MKRKKIIALTLTAMMTIGYPLSVYAEEPAEGAESGKVETEKEAEAEEADTGEKEGEAEKTDTGEKEREADGKETGVGEIEGNVEKNIYQVILPTVNDEVFNFIIDPQELINKTNGAAYGNMTFEKDATLFFKRSDGKVKENYSSKSDEVTITNKSSVAIDVSVEVSVSKESLGGIKLTGDKDFTDDTDASLYLALKDRENEIPITEEGLVVDVTVDAAPEGAYEYKYDDAAGKYIYEMSSDVSGIVFSDYSFQLVGASNGNGDWSELTKAAPEISVSWKINPKNE